VFNDLSTGIILKLLIVDDMKIIRDGLSEAMSAIRELTRIECAADVQSAVTLLDELMPDIVLLDMHLGDGDGVSVLQAIRDKDQGARVVVLTRFPGYSGTCEKFGVDYFFDKTEAPEKVVLAVTQLARAGRLQRM
jgi:DNA-binding NarL/FixJ family response regulator